MKLKNRVLNNKMTNKVVKGTVDGILNVVKRIAGQAQLTTFDEVYEFVLNMDPDEFAAYQIPSSDQPVAEPEESHDLSDETDLKLSDYGLYKNGDRLAFRLKGEENELSD